MTAPVESGDAGKYFVLGELRRAAAERANIWAGTFKSLLEDVERVPARSRLYMPDPGFGHPGRYFPARPQMLTDGPLWCEGAIEFGDGPGAVGVLFQRISDDRLPFCLVGGRLVFKDSEGRLWPLAGRILVDIMSFNEHTEGLGFADELRAANNLRTARGATEAELIAMASRTVCIDGRFHVHCLEGAPVERDGPSNLAAAGRTRLKSLQAALETTCWEDTGFGRDASLHADAAAVAGSLVTSEIGELASSLFARSISWCTPLIALTALCLVAEIENAREEREARDAA